MSHKAFLIVHDPELFRALNEILRSWGCVINASRDAKKAICIVNAVNPDLIICQDEMPHISGRQLGRLFKAHAALSKIPFLLLSETLPPVDELARAKSRLETDDIIPLPLNRAQFSESLARWLPAENRPGETGAVATDGSKAWARGSLTLAATSRLLINLVQTNSAGTLEIVGDRRELRARVARGLLLDVRSNYIREHTLCRYLADRGVIAAGVHDRAVELAAELRTPAGEALVMIGAVSKASLTDLLTQHKLAKFAKIFTAAWDPAHFRFVAEKGRVSPGDMLPAKLTDVLYDGVMKTAAHKDIRGAFVRRALTDRPIFLRRGFERAAALLNLAAPEIEHARRLAGRTIAELGPLSPQDHDRNLRLLFLLASAKGVRFGALAAEPPATGTAAASQALAPPPSWDYYLFLKIMAEAERLLRANEPEKAREQLQRAVNLNPASSTALARLAWAEHLADGAANSPAAVATKDLLKKAIALDDSNAEAYFYLGKILQAESKQALAEVMYARAEKLNPKLKPAAGAVMRKKKPPTKAARLLTEEPAE